MVQASEVRKHVTNYIKVHDCQDKIDQKYEGILFYFIFVLRLYFIDSLKCRTLIWQTYVKIQIELPGKS